MGKLRQKHTVKQEMGQNPLIKEFDGMQEGNNIGSWGKKTTRLAQPETG